MRRVTGRGWNSLSLLHVVMGFAALEGYTPGHLRLTIQEGTTGFCLNLYYFSFAPLSSIFIFSIHIHIHIHRNPDTFNISSQLLQYCIETLSTWRTRGIESGHGMTLQAPSASPLLASQMPIWWPNKFLLRMLRCRSSINGLILWQHSLTTTDTGLMAWKRTPGLRDTAPSICPPKSQTRGQITPAS